MTPSETAPRSVEPIDDVGHAIPMDVDEDADQIGQNPRSHATTRYTPPGGVLAVPETKKLTLRERLDRLSKHRIRASAIRTSVKPGASGGKADVVRASFKPNKNANIERVAVKKLRFADNSEEKCSKEFVHEVGILAKLNHPNIVRLVGFVEDFRRDKAWIVMAWAPNGNVRDFLASGKWEIPERIWLIRGMFDGLKYLHTRRPPIRHGDLKSLNILVSATYDAIIADFGSARSLSGTEQQTAGRDADKLAEIVATVTERRACPPAGSEVRVVASAKQLTLTGPAWSLRWAPPEVVSEEDHSCLSSDIWSAGWVCWEIMTDQLPFSELATEVDLTLEIVQGMDRLTPEHAELRHVIKLCSLMTDCWKFMPDARPNATRCSNTVEWMLSIQPLGGTPSRAKSSSTALLVQKGCMYYYQSCYKTAASLFHQAVASASEADDHYRARALEMLGYVYNAQSKYAEAERSYAQAREIYILTGNGNGQIQTLYGLGEIDRFQSKYTEAERFSVQARDIYIRIGHDHGQAITLRGLGEVYRLQSKYAEAERFYVQARDISIRIGHDRGQANTLYGLGEVYRFQAKYAEAERFYVQARDISIRVGQDLGQANTLYGLGDVYRLQSKYAEAERFYVQARDIYIRIGHDHGQAITLRGLGEVYRLQSKYPEAERFYVQARDIYIRIGHDEGQAETLFGLGEVYRFQSKYTEAERFSVQARDISIRIGHDRGQANTLYGLGEVYRLQSKYAEAERCHVQARDIYIRIGHDEGQANTLHGLGMVYRLQSKYAEAERCHAQARDIYIRIGDDEGQTNTLDGLGDVHRLQSKYAEAETLYVQAQYIYIRVGDDEGRAKTLSGLGHLRQLQNYNMEAAKLFTEAKELYARRGNRSAEADVSYWLAIALENYRLSATLICRPSCPIRLTLDNS